MAVIKKVHRFDVSWGLASGRTRTVSLPEPVDPRKCWIVFQTYDPDPTPYHKAESFRFCPTVLTATQLTMYRVFNGSNQTQPINKVQLIEWDTGCDCDENTWNQDAFTNQGAPLFDFYELTTFPQSGMTGLTRGQHFCWNDHATYGSSFAGDDNCTFEIATPSTGLPANNPIRHEVTNISNSSSNLGRRHEFTTQGIKYDSCTVAHGYSTMSALGTTADINFGTTITGGDTLLLFSYAETVAANNSPATIFCDFADLNSTSVRASRVAANGALHFVCQAVKFTDGTTVTRYPFSIADGVATDAITVPAVNQDETSLHLDLFAGYFAKSTYNPGNDIMMTAACAASFNSNTEVLIERGNTSGMMAGDLSGHVSVVEWNSGGGTPSTFDPQDAIDSIYGNVHGGGFC